MGVGVARSSELPTPLMRLLSRTIYEKGSGWIVFKMGATDKLRMLELLFDTSRFARALAKIVELGASNFAAALDLNVGDRWTEGLKNTFYSFAIRDLPYGKRRIEAAVALGDNDPLKGLKSLALPLLDLNLNNDGVARMELRNLFRDLLGLELLNDVAHARTCFSDGIRPADTLTLRLIRRYPPRGGR